MLGSDSNVYRRAQRADVIHAHPTPERFAGGGAGCEEQAIHQLTKKVA
jgi:hypothetical protein